MKFEHLLEVNPASPSSFCLTRSMLWFGLLCRAEDSRSFLPGLEECRIVERGETFLSRILRFGKAEVHDRVVFQPKEWIRFETEQTEHHAGGTLTISIEESGENALFLRFSYLTTLRDDAADEDGRYADFIRAAYYQSDLDTLKIIREIAQSGRLQ